MNNYDFVVWLEGYLDLCPTDAFDAKKTRIIRNHLNLVKTVEGELGPFNAEIYKVISTYLDNNVIESEYITLHKKLKSNISNFLLEAFPESIVS